MKRLDHFPFQASANNQTLLIDKNFSFEDSYRVSPDIPQWVSTVKMPITIGMFPEFFTGFPRLFHFSGDCGGSRRCLQLHRPLTFHQT